MIPGSAPDTAAHDARVDASDISPDDADPQPVKPRNPTGGSGPLVALLFHRLLAAIFLVAWISLATQVRLLIGSRGLLPIAEFVEAARAEGALSLTSFPSLLMLAPGDDSLLAGALFGVALSIVALAGVRPRVCAAVQTALYLGYVTACRGFLGFQWDNLILECGLLATFLPTDRPSRITHFLFRALLFKLYFESGIAKWQSPLHDWRDGSAMTFYYETAPLPTVLAWYAHHLPRWWHGFESQATLFLELVVPFAALGPRRARLVTALLLTVFQVVNLATANYGFFCYLTLALHVFLLDDRDVQRVSRFGALITAALMARLHRLFGPFQLLRLPRRRVVVRDATLLSRGGALPRLRRASAVGAAVVWILISQTEAVFHFGDLGAAGPALMPLLEIAQTFRLVNTYHLFAAVTRERIEPEFQIQSRIDGDWTAHDLRYKAGDLTRAPAFVAPHQPRVDFFLWFYGLGYQRRMPTYVANLLARLCEDPRAVAPLFVSPLPPAAHAVRIVFWEYHFTSRAEMRSTGAWWSRQELGATRSMTCAR